MNNKKFILLIIIFFLSKYLNAQECKCNSDDYKNWDTGLTVRESGEINFLESLKVIIKEQIQINNGNMLAVMSRINYYHNGYYFYFNAYFKNKIKIPEKGKIRLTNNKKETFYVTATKNVSVDSEYYIFISQNDISFKNFLNSNLITKVEFIGSRLDNIVIANYFLSFSESVELTKLFCCAIKLKKEVVGQEN